MLPTAATLSRVISPPRKRPRSGYRHGVTDSQRRELRQYWAKAPDHAKPTQVEIATWFSVKYHPISQSTVSDSLKPIYDYLDKEKRLARAERLARKDGNWPDLEAALYQWQLAINRKNNQVTGLLFQEMERRLWLRMPQYRNLLIPKFSSGWFDSFKTRHSIARKKRHGEAGKIDV
jgi:Fission yeast centromere protein N-terminal domain/Tc5 transposase DNA-binding domain